MERLPHELYGGSDTEVNAMGLRGFYQLYEFVQVFRTLTRLGFNDTDITLFRIFTEQILNDASKWVSRQQQFKTVQATKRIEKLYSINRALVFIGQSIDNHLIYLYKPINIDFYVHTKSDRLLLSPFGFSPLTGGSGT